MITEDYVSFETAKLLKEKGFDGECSRFYMPNGHGRWKYEHYHDFDISNRIECPTLQMAMKWLREVHTCYITFTWEFKEYDENSKPIYKDITWSFNVAIPKYNSARRGDGDYFDIYDEEEYDSYEQACEAAIKYCLENLI